MTERESRLRERIDTLTDERDRARGDLAAIRLRVKRLRGQVKTARSSRDLWRFRAIRDRRGGELG